MRCIHCLKEFNQVTNDHVFPKSWYPDSTPTTVQYWCAPSCLECNKKLGKQEEKLFSRLALSTNPTTIASSGIAEKALRSYGVRAGKLSLKESLIRKNLREKIIQEIQDFSAEKNLLMPRADDPLKNWDFKGKKPVKIPIDGSLFKSVYEKIIRGCEYVLGNRRYVEFPYKIEIYNNTVREKFKVVSDTLAWTTTLGPGFEIKRGFAEEDPKSVLYEIVLWGSHEILSLILIPDIEKS